MKKTQNKETRKKEDINRKSSIIFMQLGLVLALLLAFIAIESKTLVDNQICEYPAGENDLEVEFIPETTHKKPIPDKPKPKPIIEPVTIDIIKDDNPDETADILFGGDDDEYTPVEITIDSIIEVKIPEPVIEDVKFKDIKDAPVFPGCKGSFEKVKACFSKKVQKHVSKNFNADLAEKYGLNSGIKRIRVQFTVDKTGNIVDVIAKGPHKGLEKEARRVVDMLPKMTPGKQRGRPVGVKFYLPITFRVE